MQVTNAVRIALDGTVPASAATFTAFAWPWPCPWEDADVSIDQLAVWPPLLASQGPVEKPRIWVAKVAYVPRLQKEAQLIWFARLLNFSCFQSLYLHGCSFDA